MKKTSAFLAVLGLASLGFAASALAQAAQDEIPARKLDRLERQVKEVRDIVLQAKATGAPVEIREAGPDPAIIALQGRFDDIDQSLRNLNGQIEVLTHEIDLARKDATDARAKAEALDKRVQKLEQKIEALQAAPPPVSDGPAPAPPPSPQATPPAPAADEPAAAYGRAKQMLLNGDYPAAGAAFQDFVDRYGDSPRGPEARYWLGETKFIQSDYSGAAAAYIDAVRGWPQTGWAPDAVAKLALSLVQLKKPADACGILATLPAHYPKLSDKTKARAAEARAKAQCAP